MSRKTLKNDVKKVKEEYEVNVNINKCWFNLQPDSPYSLMATFKRGKKSEEQDAYSFISDSGIDFK